ARSEAGERLLAAASEHERVAALEAHHPASGLSVLDEQPVDLLLRQRVVPGGLAHVDHEHRRVEVVDQGPRRQPVDEHDVSLGEQSTAADADQTRVARTATYQ